MTTKRHMAFYLVAMLGFAILISLLCVLFMFLLTQATSLLYTALPGALHFPQQFWPVVYCLAGGLLVGLVIQKWGRYPKLLLEVMGDFAKTRRVEYKNGFVLKDAGSAFVILLFGAALGPEAALSGLAGSLGTYTVDRMERNPATKALRKNHPAFKRVVFALQWVVSVALYMVLTDWLAVPSFIYRYTATSFQWRGLVWFLPLLALGIVLGLVFALAEKGFAKLFRPDKGRHILAKTLLTGAVLGITGVFAPLLLFSGEAQLPTLVQQAGGMAPALLLAFAVAKLLLAALCLQTGWRGGFIFPLVFSSFSLAFGLSALLPVDAAFAAAVILATVFSFITKQPLVAALFIFLYFPVSFIPYILLAACLASPKKTVGMLKTLYLKLQRGRSPHHH